jgi:hypothetical protein
LRLEGDYTEEIGDWVRSEAIKRGMSTRKFLSHIAADYKERSSETPDGPKKPRSKRSQLISLVRENNSPVRSAVRLGVSLADLREWSSDPGYAAELEAAKAYWVEGLQEDMRAIGAGRKHGDANALSRLLNAHHPAFGRAKTEMILRIIDPLVRELVRDLQSELGEEAKEAIQRCVDRWQVKKRKKLSLVG